MMVSNDDYIIIMVYNWLVVWNMNFVFHIGNNNPN